MTGTLYLGSLGAACEPSLLQVLDGPWLPTEEADDDGSLPPFAYFRIDIGDAADAAPRLRKELARAYDYIRDALAGGGNVLVHCHQGVSRSASVVIAFLIRDRGMGYAAACAFVRNCRRCVRPNTGFEAVLREWEGVCRAADEEGGGGKGKGAAESEDTARAQPPHLDDIGPGEETRARDSRLRWN